MIQRVAPVAYSFGVLALAAATMPVSLHAETGYKAWLRYSTVEAKARYNHLPATLTVLGDSEVIEAAGAELVTGIRAMLGRIPRLQKSLPDDTAIVVGTLPAIRAAAPEFRVSADLAPDGYWLKTSSIGGHKCLVVAGTNERGTLYGAFALLRKIGLRQAIMNLDERQEPYAPVRWVNEWDNLDGTIERGYGGRSIFFENGKVRADLGRVRDYARMLASLGINGCAVNNVNANPRVITAGFLPGLARLAEAFRPWGVRLCVAVDFSSPRRIGGLDTFDPHDPRVELWWKDTVDRIYESIPDFAGFVLKADSEGRLGPSAYGRTHADAANVIARALKPHGGLICYRGFVYDHHMDWRNLKNDRARAAYDNFAPLDGQFEDNVVIQIKNGPIDFQVREPASPLFGALEKANQAIELQITQEYFGQARHMVYLAPMWQEVLDFDLQAGRAGTPVKALVGGKVFGQPLGGFVGVSNVGLDTNWTGHQLSQANLYGFGRLAWDPNLDARDIAEEWARLTYSHNPSVVNTIVGLLMDSWPTYENYTGPLGAQTLTDITGNHYGPAVEASERNGWGQWHRADEKGIGMDRTVATGTGFIGQYRPAVAKVYESLETCPDELILWMHHVPYTHVLHSGKTVIQHIYDSHYKGAEDAEGFVARWQSLKRRIDEQRYLEVLDRLTYQAGHAQVWRDSICNWFLKTSGIPDEQGRAGNFPGRIEAESMRLDGYRQVDVTPWETASGGQAIECASATGECAASFLYDGEAGWCDLEVQYFDQNNGVSKYQVFLRDQLVDEWLADNDIPTPKPDGHSSTRRRIGALALRPGDEIQISGRTDDGEHAALDYVEIKPVQPEKN